MKIRLHNDARTSLRLMMEPIANSYDVEPGQEVTIVGDFESEGETVEIQVGNDNSLSIFGPIDTVVFQNGNALQPLLGV